MTCISFAQSFRLEYDRKIGDLAQKLFEEKHEISLTSLASLEFQLRALQKVVSWLNLPIQLTNFLKNEQDWLRSNGESSLVALRWNIQMRYLETEPVHVIITPLNDKDVF